MKYRCRFYVLLIVPLWLSIFACGALPAHSKPAIVITLAPDDVPANITPDSLNTACLVLQNRLNEALEKPAKVLVNGDNLQVELSGADDLTTTIQLATQIGAVAFYDWSSPVSPGTNAPDGAKIILTDKDVAHAEASSFSEAIGWQVVVSLTPSGARKLQKYTEANVEHYVVITHDGMVIACSIVRQPIRGGQAAITDHFDKVYAKSLAVQLNSGQLPFRLKVVDKKQ